MLLTAAGCAPAGRAVRADEDAPRYEGTVRAVQSEGVRPSPAGGADAPYQALLVEPE
jgi:hypothetical protein